MDRVPKLDWSWMRRHMPRVVAMIEAARQRGDSALVNECWRRGVLNGEPGWFYARENGVSVGVPSKAFLVDPTQEAVLQQFPMAAILVLKERAVDHGA